MITGVDFSFSRVPPAIAAAAGHRFGVSYLTDLDTSHRAKAWTAGEIAAYRAAGLGVVAVWQGGGADRTTAWRGGFARGARDARLAAQQSGALGRPEGANGRPVYFAIDSDVSDAELSLVSAYFDGVASIFDVANIGVYGGRRVIVWAQQSGKARWFWQTGAWSGGVRVPGIHLYQRVPPTKLGPYDVDVDEALQADYGAWFDAVGGGAVDSNWYPGARRLELRPESTSQPKIRPTQFILHSIIAPWSEDRMYEYWRDSTNLESTWGLDYDGSLGQYLPTSVRADANAGANLRSDGTGAVSMETASNTSGTDPWTAQQIRAIVETGVWCHRVLGIPLRICRTADDPGFGYHSLHRAWSTSGTACPGPARIKQFNEVVFPGIVAAASGVPGSQSQVPVEEFDMPVLGGELKPGFDPVGTLIIPPSVPDGRRMFANIGADMGRVRGRVDIFVTGRGWQQLGVFDLNEKSDLAFYPLPAGTRKVNIKRLPGEGLDPATPAAWNVEVV